MALPTALRSSTGCRQLSPLPSLPALPVAVVVSRQRSPLVAVLETGARQNTPEFM